MKFHQRLLAIGVVCLSCALVQAKESRPNILWITAEDMSPTLGCYGDDFAHSPNVDRFSRQGTRYLNAFATAPVCSPSRECLINGCIATTQGAHPMRSQLPLPAQMVGFPKWMRDQGYYTTNNEKTDYNSAAANQIREKSWDESSDKAHWRGRKPGQPFFAVFNLMTTHQSRTMVWPYPQFQDEVQSKLDADLRNKPHDVPLPPYYPDTPLVRKTVARFYDCVSVMDSQVGELLRQLDEDGLADETIVFFYSDHGSGMPRHKRALFDSGMKVPLIIRFPEKYKNLRPTQPGQTTDRLVCFEDFAPTVLSLLGMDSMPPFMRGKPFLGKLASRPRDYVFGHRDRVDEIMDMSRSVRSKHFLYIRNFMPHLGWNQQSAWIDQGKIRDDFYALDRSGNANAAQQQYLASSRPIEELYDCKADPLNLNNLADSAEHKLTILTMRVALETHLSDSRDLGFVPELELERLKPTPIQWSKQHLDTLAQARMAAHDVGKSESRFAKWLRHSDRHARFWGCVACRSASTLSPQTQQTLVGLMDDESDAVQVAAADAVFHQVDTGAAVKKLKGLLQSDNPTLLLHAARVSELTGDPRLSNAMRALFERFEHAEGDSAWFIRFTTTGYLSRLESQANE